MQKLESYYKKFNEDHRLKTRHGQVEFFVTMHYIKKFLSQIAAQSENEKIKILDVGAATGAYSIPLCREGFDVTAVELTKTNFDILRSKHENIKCWNADARDLNFLADETFDITLLLGPLYHLHAQKEKLQTLLEARRVTK
ncbi:MAG: class I SAM-dependent methyltransferase, partial [Treponemataceae bacterium]|nr:class I SAM-dependent methyltransferase [Treponemataceae bacterium]